MSELIITGGKALRGIARVPGAKNAILPILAATLLCEEELVITNCPRYRDVRGMLEILKLLGCDVRWDDILTINPANAHRWEMPDALAKELRSSIFMLGPVIGRFKKAVFTYPGGCEIGQRPIDLHLKGLRSLNVQIEEDHGYILCRAHDLRGNDVHLDYPSVGATENIMMAAVYAKGVTRIYNAAREPEIEDLQAFLCAMGANIRGAGGNCIEIVGVKKLHGAQHTIIPDRIVAGTLMAGAAMTGGELFIRNIQRDHMQAVVNKFEEAGCILSFQEDNLQIKAPKRLKEIHLLETQPHPGFPTDMQAQMFALCTIAEGTSVIMENVFESRFKHAPELVRMGANITIKNRMAVIRGVEALHGTRIAARDLRGCAALILAGMSAQGETILENAELADRGYEDIALMFNALGAQIDRREH
ncbi:MAG: UDP-N-acetylglucosamine 1-carboxyvinyltransferase [Christensenellales bacterium]|jgi:UDP-N-acetylglucosamine 1-carboxyvinyltransferase